MSHHAYYLAGDRSLVTVIEDMVKDDGLVHAEANGDYYRRDFSSFTIDDARELRIAHETRPTHPGGWKIFILYFGGITVEAQNALLKLFEEPAEYAKFFIIIPSEHLLLPTVRSRLALLEIANIAPKKHASGSDMPGSVRSLAEKFVSSSQAERLLLIKKLMDDIANEKRTKQDAIDLVHAIEKVLYERKLGIGNDPARMQAMHVIQIAGKYAYDRSPSLKMLLEFVALSI